MTTPTETRGDAAPAKATGRPRADAQAGREADGKIVHRLDQHIVEIVSDSGEGAQTCGKIFGTVSARMGNGVWTVEIIPAEIEPPARSPAGASGNRIRLGSREVTNWGDYTNLVIAFNEQVLLARHRAGALAPDATILLEDMWKRHDDPDILDQWSAAMEELGSADYRIIPVPMEKECLEVVDDARRGKNMFALGVLSAIYGRDRELLEGAIARRFAKKDDEITRRNVELLDRGMRWAEGHLDFQIEVPPTSDASAKVVMNGNQAIALGAIAAGLELASMYPITPASSVSHYLAEIFQDYGGILHQAEDEIAAAGVAIGASFSGKTAFTITSGPGMALKTEFLGLAIMTETPLVVVDVQRGGPSTGLPTRVEQSDLLAALFGQPGDAPHVVLAPATIEECFHSMVLARRIAETFRTVVIVLSDANLATGVQPFPRPEPRAEWQGSPPDQGAVPDGARPYEWDPRTGLSTRFIPGQEGGQFTATGLAHDEESHVAYDPQVNQRSSRARSRKLAVLQSTLTPPPIYGEGSGDLLVVGWGSTKGAIEEAVERARAEGLSVSSTHLTFLSPLPPGLTEMFGRFGRVMTVEINYSDEPDDPFITPENRRRGQLAWLLRAQTLVDVDCWTRVMAEPLRPGSIHEVIRDRLAVTGGVA
ncbi:MAG: 2-oxoacid:acceptor oxidoreductase subunit alpha [Candidatus Palauibacterales bacterium]|nr:2-oxoacid:acceptor oxidoreductase subunit alpha [Candidatus Palauibacterales bacterium]MDP2530908.1 2-oxoacid:acceptor oxidoreductase subunit alpha [Candidatus Palauibacterales bacterium]MDP2582769.1 2-oxoacid:acceptor oxidoreductase subunit alpha [Candidatus Palauibacterales bacterium]